MNPSKKMPKAFIFDCGDTLFNVLNFNFEAIYKYFYNNIIDNSKVTYDEYVKFSESIMHVFSERDLNNIEILFSNYFNFITFAFGNKSDKDLNTIELEFAHTLYQSKPVKDVFLFLDFLKSKNIPMYVLSNSLLSTNEIKLELKENGLDEYFIDIISSGDHLFRKPSKELFLMYLKRLQMDGIDGDVCYIGNSYKYDIVTPVELKMYSILLNEKLECEYINHGDYLEVNGYKTLISILREVSNG